MPRGSARILAVTLSLAVSLSVDARPLVGPSRPTVAIMDADARQVAAQTDEWVHVWDRESGKHLARVRNPEPFRGTLSPGALTAVSGKGITVHRGERYDRPVALKVPRLLSTGRTAVSADGTVAAAMFARDGGVGDPDTVGVWDARTGALRGRVTLPRARVLGMTLSRDGRRVAIFGDRPARKGAVLWVVPVRSRGLGQPLLRWHHAGDRTTYCAAFAPPAARRLVLCAGKRLLLWDLKRRRIEASATTAAALRLFPSAVRKRVREFPPAHGVAFSPDGKELLTLHGIGVLGVARWSAAPLEPTAWIKRPLVGGTMRQVAWDGRGGVWLVTSGYTPRVTVHQPRAGRFAPVRVLQP